MMTTLVALFVLAQKPETISLEAAGLQRTAIVYRPSKESPKTPVVFVFHGHGGSGTQIARSRPIHKLWPEAVVIYPTGLTGVKGVTDPDGKRRGWQKGPGTLDDRDLKLFDELLKWAVEEYDATPDRTFVTGHSNGSQFAWLVLAKRGDKIGAVAGSCAPGGLWMRTSPHKPAFIIAGIKDNIVSIEIMRRYTALMTRLYQNKKSKTRDDGIIIYTGKKAPIWVWEYDGPHRVPQDTTKRIVEFFKKQSGNPPSPLP